MRQTLSKGMAVAAAATGVLSLYGGSALADSDAHGAAQGSPGVLSGNNIQVPVNIPVNICGNSVDAAAALDPAFANSCATHGGRGEGADEEHADSGGGGPQDSGHGGSGNTGYGDSGDSGYGNSGGHHSTPPSGGGSHSTPPYGDGHSAPPYGGGKTTPPPYDGGHSAPPYGGGKTTPPPYGGEETTQPPHGGGKTTPPPYGGEETTRPPYGGDETTPPYGGEESTPPGGGHATPPGGEYPQEPPLLAHTGGDGPAMIATSAASAALIAAGAVLYRRGRSASRR
ncbi:chaplin [Streptomyces olivaceoviridis]|uniref:chaplin n=1 Tax=Streptomyces olivaceoviridis TaxID=1921 RepID=UPI00368187DC